jgi:hypothetical protein
MPINPNIILGVQQPQFKLADPLESAGRALSLQNMMGQQDLQGMQMRQAQQAEADDLATRDAFKAGGDHKAIIDRLMGAGQYKPAQALQKTMLEAEEKRGTINKNRAETMGKLLTFQKDGASAVMANPTAESALAAVDQFERMATNFGMPELGQQAATQRAEIKAAGNNPDALRRIASGWALTADKFLPQLSQVNDGKTTRFLDTNPLSNQNAGTQTVTMLTTPGQDQADVRAREMAAAARAQAAATRDQAAATREANAVTYDADRGVLVNRATGEARPAMQGGQPIGPKERLTDTQKKELASIDSQQNILKGALAEVDKTPDAFGTVRGLATMAGAIPESMAGKLDSPAQREARSYVFNVVSKVINERAGAAQSAQELARLRSFLPAETDNAQQVKDKLTSFSSYLENSRAGYDRPQGARAPAQPPRQLVPGATRAGPVAQPGGVKFLGFE